VSTTVERGSASYVSTSYVNTSYVSTTVERGSTSYVNTSYVSTAVERGSMSYVSITVERAKEPSLEEGSGKQRSVVYGASHHTGQLGEKGLPAVILLCRRIKSELVCNSNCKPPPRPIHAEASIIIFYFRES
jgi:hypothetical protein